MGKPGKLAFSRLAYFSCGQRSRCLFWILHVFQTPKYIYIYLFVPFSSHHPCIVLKGIVYTQILRLLKTNSSFEKFEQSWSHLSSKFKDRGYPNSLLRETKTKWIANFTRHRHDSWGQQLRKEEQHNSIKTSIFCRRGANKPSECDCRSGRGVWFATCP